MAKRQWMTSLYLSHSGVMKPPAPSGSDRPSGSAEGNILLHCQYCVSPRAALRIKGPRKQLADARQSRETYQIHNLLAEIHLDRTEIARMQTISCPCCGQPASSNYQEQKPVGLVHRGSNIQAATPQGTLADCHHHVRIDRYCCYAMPCRDLRLIFTYT
jgi:hypothetical protein